VRGRAVGSAGQTPPAFNWTAPRGEKITIRRHRPETGWRFPSGAWPVTPGSTRAGVERDCHPPAWPSPSWSVRRLARRRSPGEQRGTSNIGGLIHGGGPDQRAHDQVEPEGQARSHDPKFRGDDRAARSSKPFECSQTVAARRALRQRRLHRLAGLRVRSSWRTTSLCVLRAEAAVRSIGATPVRAISNGGLDANWMTVHGIPAVTWAAPVQRAHRFEKLASPRFTRPAASLCGWPPDGIKRSYGAAPWNSTTSFACVPRQQRKVIQLYPRRKTVPAGPIERLFGAGTGCGWCRTFLKRLFDEASQAERSRPMNDRSDYARQRAGLRPRRRRNSATRGDAIDPIPRRHRGTGMRKTSGPPANGYDEPIVERYAGKGMRRALPKTTCRRLETAHMARKFDRKELREKTTPQRGRTRPKKKSVRGGRGEEGPRSSAKAGPSRQGGSPQAFWGVFNQIHERVALFDISSESRRQEGIGAVRLAKVSALRTAGQRSDRRVGHSTLWNSTGSNGRIDLGTPFHPRPHRRGGKSRSQIE